MADLTVLVQVLRDGVVGTQYRARGEVLNVPSASVAALIRRGIVARVESVGEVVTSTGS